MFIQSEDDEQNCGFISDFDPKSWALRDTSSDVCLSDEDDGETECVENNVDEEDEEDSDDASSPLDQSSTDSADFEPPNATPMIGTGQSIDSEWYDSDETNDEYETRFEFDSRKRSGGRRYTDYDVFIYWYHIVRVFSDRVLSYNDDKLPAIEGLAREMAEYCDVGIYLAGLWEKDLGLGLLWTTSTWTIEFFKDEQAARVDFWPPAYPKRDSRTWRIDEVELPVQRPASYRAPSWSWASLDGWTRWPGWPQFSTTYGAADRHIKQLNGAIEIVDFSIDYAGESIFGRIKYAQLTLKARYFKVSSISDPQSHEEANLEPDPANRDPSLPYSVHNSDGIFAYAYFDLGKLPTTDLYVLKTVNQPSESERNTGFEAGLVLQEDEASPGFFRRVGIFGISGNHFDAFDDIEAKLITLI
ncbi:unnamed protein product [Discula destructiva]